LWCTWSTGRSEVAFIIEAFRAEGTCARVSGYCKRGSGYFISNIASQVEACIVVILVIPQQTRPVSGRRYEGEWGKIFEH